MGYLCILLAVCSGLTEGFLIKKYNQKHTKGGFIFTAIVSLCSMLFFLFSDLITDNSGLSFPLAMLPYAIIAGILYCTASVMTYFALNCGSFAITMLILSYALVFSTVYGLVFLNESASAFTYIGFVLIALSLFFVRGASEKKEDGTAEKRFSAVWLICIVLSVIGAGMFGVLQRMQQVRFDDAVTNEFMVVALGISAVILFVVGLVKDKKDCGYIFKNGSPYALGAGLANGATNMLNMIAYTMIAISVAAPTEAGVKIIISFLLSCFVFKEKFFKRQIIGVILGAIAVVFLNI